MPTLSFKNINKIYPNKVQAVFDFNLNIKDKEFIVFVGPSGCGKSTTLRMVAGLEDITSGELYIDNKMVNDIPPKDRDIAMVFQNYALYPHMTVYKNMSYALKLRKVDMPLYVEDKDNQEINALLEKNKELRKQINKINREFKRKQDASHLLDPREKLYASYYENFEKIQKLRKPLIGKDEYNIAKLTRNIESLKQDVNDYKILIKGKYAGEQDKIAILNKGIELRETQIKKMEEQLKYLETHEIPLVKSRHLTKEEIDIEINKTAASIDLIRYLFRKPSELSGGQRQRVALGRAIVRKPKVFLMDEPLSNLDAKLRVQTRGEIAKIHQRVGATTIYVTHDQTEAMTMADRIVIMKEGYVQQIGSPEEVYGDPANLFVAGFIGSPAMNFIKTTYAKGALSIDEIKPKVSNTNLLANKTNYKNISIKLSKSQAATLDKYCANKLTNLKKKKAEINDNIAKLKEANKKVSKEKELEQNNKSIKELEASIVNINEEIASLSKKSAEIILGVRPEALFPQADKHNSKPSKPIESICDFSELLGAEFVLYVYVNGQKIVIKTEKNPNIKNGDKLSFRINLDKIYFFDPKTEERIR